MFRVFLLFLVFGLCNSAKIVIFHPIYGGSHVRMLQIFGDYLTSRGHSVTQIIFSDNKSSGPPKGSDSNVTVVELSVKRFREDECIDYINDEGEVDMNRKAGDLLWNDGESIYGLPTDIFCVTRAHCHTLYNVHWKRINSFLRREKFDLAIVDLISNECGLAVAKSLGVPVVGFWLFSFQGGETMRSATFNPPSIVPALISGLPYTSFSFSQRIYNFLLYLTHYALLIWQETITEAFIRERFPELPSVKEMLYDLDLTFIHTNFLVDSPKLLTPNTKYVGGLHIRSPRPLPKDLKNFIEGAEVGVIVFSFGFTGYSAKAIPSFFTSSLLKVFAELPGYRVIMRHDEKWINSPIPNNVKIVEWFPQQDVLAHPNTKLLITHGGMGSVQESVYYGVPMIAIAIFGDQNDNAARIQDYGLGRQILKRDISLTSLNETIKEVLFNPKYTKKVELFRDMWREEMVSSREEAAHWIEKLVKFRNFEHLKIRADKLSIIQYFSLDVIAFLLCFVVLFFGILSFSLYRICSRTFRVLQGFMKIKIKQN